MNRLASACALLACVIGCGGPSREGAAPEPALPEPVAPPVTPVRVLHVAPVNGTTLHYRVLGPAGAPAVVFVHGTLSNLTTWSAQDTAFARDYRVLVYSRRYHPPNSRLEDGQVYSPQLHAEDLAALLLRLQLAPAHVVGSSYGAYVALALTREHPSLVRSLVLGEPPVLALLTSPAGDSVRRAFLTLALDPARSAFAHGDSVAGLRAFLEGVSGIPGRFDNLPEPARADLLRHAFEMRLEMLAQREQYLAPVTCAELGRLTTPTLVVRGERSPRLFQLISDELARCLRNDSTVTIPGASHAMHAGNPRYYNVIVQRFLAAH